MKPIQESSSQLIFIDLAGRLSEKEKAVDNAIKNEIHPSAFFSNRKNKAESPNTVRHITSISPIPKAST